MNFNSFLKTPLFFGLCLGSAIAIAGTGLMSLAGIIITLAISVLYTIFYKQYVNQSFKIWAIASSGIANAIVRMMWPFQSAESYLGTEIANQLKEALKTLLAACTKAFGINATYIGFIIIFASILTTHLLLEYFLITLGNKLGLMLLTTKSEK